jgi:hypothetical protein
MSPDPVEPSLDELPDLRVGIYQEKLTGWLVRVVGYAQDEASRGRYVVLVFPLNDPQRQFHPLWLAFETDDFFASYSWVGTIWRGQVPAVEMPPPYLLVAPPRLPKLTLLGHEHYKSNSYGAIHLAYDVGRLRGDTLSRQGVVVVYHGCVASEDNYGVYMWIRALEEFLQPVCWVPSCPSFGKDAGFVVDSGELRHCAGCGSLLQPRFIEPAALGC